MAFEFVIFLLLIVIFTLISIGLGKHSFTMLIFFIVVEVLGAINILGGLNISIISEQVKILIAIILALLIFAIFTFLKLYPNKNNTVLPPRLLSIALPLIILILAILPSNATGMTESYDIKPYQVNKVSTKEERSSITQTGADIVEIGINFVTIRATAQEASQIAKLGFSIEPLAQIQDFPPADAAYHNYAEMLTEIQQVAAAHPDIVSYFSIGQSYEGRELRAAKISDNVNVDEENEPEVLFIGHHHGKEHLTVEMTLYILNLLAGQYGSDTQITDLVNSREIYIIFDANPDGGEYDIATGTYLSWRKNRQPDPGPSYIGIDLNRNYSYKWGCCGGSSADPSSENYRGSAAFSAPETARIRDFINSRVIDGKQQITTSISFHSYAEEILWPYAYTYTDIPADMTQDDHDVFMVMGNDMATTNGYTPKQASDLYLTDGSYEDWAYGVYKIFTYMFEMYPNADPPGFYPPAIDIDHETSRNEQAVRYIIQQADCPYRTISKESIYCSTLPTFLLTVNRTGTGSGTVTSSPAGIDCGSTCSASFYYNSTIKLSAAQAAGSTFTGWSGGGCSGTGTCTVTMNSDKTVTANFTQNAYTLTVISVHGAVTKAPDQPTYTYGTSVLLSMGTVDVGWTFTGWSGGGCSGTAPCTVTMNSDITVTANFTQITHSLTITMNPAGGGTTTPSAGVHSYIEGTIVPVTAAPTAGYVFDHWNGACTGSGSCSVTISTDKNITATFKLIEYTLTVNISGSGSVTKNADKTTYHFGDVVQLTATADIGWSFSAWSGDLTGIETRKILPLTGTSPSQPPSSRMNTL